MNELCWSMLDHSLNTVIHDHQDKVFELVESSWASEREHGDVFEDHDTPTTHLLDDDISAARMHARQDLVAMDISQHDLETVSDRLNWDHFKRKLRNLAEIELTLL